MSIHTESTTTDTPAQPEPAPVLVKMIVTPDQASEWLAHNGVNRAMRPMRVEQWMRAIQTGKWTFSNDAICIAADGTLLNGQHRLTAIVRTGIPLEMAVTFNMPHDAMRHMDTGAARTYADELRMRGETYPAALAASLRLLWLIRNDVLDGSPAISGDELDDLLAEYPEIRSSVRAASRADKAIEAPISVLAAVHWLITHKNDAEVADFYLEQLSTRANEPYGSAIHAVCNRLNEAHKARMKASKAEYIYLMIKGFNYWAQNKSVAKMSMSPKNPEAPLPEVVEWGGVGK